MKLEKLASQLDGSRKQGLEAVFGSSPEPEQPTAPAPRSRKPAAASKRTTWKMRAWYVKPETAKRLAAYVNRQQESGSTVDASEVVDQAIAAWLDQQGG